MTGIIEVSALSPGRLVRSMTVKYLDLRSGSSKHLMPFCFGKYAHRCTE